MIPNPYKDEYNNNWYWFDETELSYGPYETWEEANEDLQKFVEEVLGK